MTLDFSRQQNITVFYVFMKKETGFITWINTGTIGEIAICLTVNLPYDRIIKHLKGEWLEGFCFKGTAKECLENGSWLARIVNIESRKYLYIHIPQKVNLKNPDHMVKLAHEVLHICQFYLPSFLNRDMEYEAEAYTHTYIMRQIISKIKENQ